MDITKIYTKTMHKALQNASNKNYRIDYNPIGGFIKNIHNNKQGITFVYNTCLPVVSGIASDYFKKYIYEDIVKDLQEVYSDTQNKSQYRLRSEFYQTFYVIK